MAAVKPIIDLLIMTAVANLHGAGVKGAGMGD